MTIRHLKIFLAVCSCGFNTTKAAARLHMTQPAVSLAIRELEQYYGVILFDRIGRRLKITGAGRRFLEYASRITVLFDDMEKGMRNWDSFGLLRVGASITIGSQFLPEYVKVFYRRDPGTEIRALIGPSDLLEQKLLENDLDLALMEGAPRSPHLIAEEYMEDRLVILCPADSGYRQGQEITLEEFRRHRLLLREQGSGTREIFARAAREAGFIVNPAWESMSTTALINAVMNGLGTAILPYRMVLEPLERGLAVAVHVRELSLRRRLHIVYHQEKFLTPSALAFIELCRSFELDYPLPRFPGHLQENPR